MPLQWTEKLATGLPRVDAEHRDLIEQANRLLEATRQARGRDELRPLLAYLEDYIRHHLSNEERLMRTSGYPDREAHQAEHRSFVGEYRLLAAEMAQNGPSAMVTVKLNRLLVDWVRLHLGGVDRKLGEFLRMRRRAASA
jgi:hemerythrin